MNVEGIGVTPWDGSKPAAFAGTRPELVVTIAKLAGTSFVHIVVGGVAMGLDENHAAALARILDGCVAEIQARAVSR